MCALRDLFDQVADITAGVEHGPFGIFFVVVLGQQMPLMLREEVGWSYYGLPCSLQCKFLD